MTGSPVDKIVVSSEIRGAIAPAIAIEFRSDDRAIMLKLHFDAEEIDELIATLVEHRIGTFPNADEAALTILEGVAAGLRCRKEYGRDRD